MASGLDDAAADALPLKLAKGEKEGGDANQTGTSAGVVTEDDAKLLRTGEGKEKKGTVPIPSNRHGYDRNANERNAISSLSLLNQSLLWHRLDDGVMGGQSESRHVCGADGSLHFEGIINTNGGGFCSIRAPILGGLPASTEKIRVRFTGDGKTYKFMLSQGLKDMKTPSWQIDIPTKNNGQEETVTVDLSTLKPTWGGGPRGQPSAQQKAKAQFNVQDMNQIGFMLSLVRTDGTSNPIDTFGEGVFPFSMKVRSIEIEKIAENGCSLL